MASMFKWNHNFRLPFIIFITTLLFLITNNLFFIINYTRQLGSKQITSHIKSFEKHMDRIGNEFHAHLKKNTTTYFKRARSHTSDHWFKIVTSRIKGAETINIGLVNFEGRTIDKAHFPNTNILKVNFTPIKYNEIPWPELSPERMDEHSKCPDIPMPRFEDYKNLDVVVAQVPHRRECRNGVMRDASRLQVNLIVANLLVKSGRINSPVFAVFVDSCDPMLEIFKCKDLLWNEDNFWIYKPDLSRIRQLLLMPVGPCQFVPPFSHPGNQQAWTRQTKTLGQVPIRQAYVTILHTSEDYVCGAIVLAQSIIQSNSTADMILLADNNISPRSIQGLRAAGWKTRRIQRIRSPYSKKGTYNEWNYSKLRIWQLENYDKLIFIDADIIVNRNLDRFFNYPEMTAAGNYQRHLFNSGLMVVEPSECTFRTLVNKMGVVESYNGGDQGFLNEIFAWWHRLPAPANCLKVFVDPEDRQHWIDENGVYAVHYTGLKPWKCGDKEHDCNWDAEEFGRYASDSAHKLWWKVYGRMSEELRMYCN